jgi:quinolinate synthase
VISHPECSEEILKYSDVIGSTSRLLEEVAQNKSVKEFIVATETGILHQMQKARPDATLIQAPMEGGSCGCNHCPFMKLNNLEKIRNALRSLTPSVQVDEKFRETAKLSLDRMMKISAGVKVIWPEKFSQ